MIDPCIKHAQLFPASCGSLGTPMKNNIHISHETLVKCNGSNPLKNHGVSNSWGDTFPNGKIKAMFQTTNQMISYSMLSTSLEGLFISTVP